MQYWAFLNHVLLPNKEEAKYLLVKEDGTWITAKRTLAEFVGELKILAIDHCKKGQLFELSFQVPTDVGNIVLKSIKDGAPYFRQPLTREEQLNVWEILKDIPYHE